MEVTPKEGSRGRYGIWRKKQKFGAREIRDGAGELGADGKKVIPDFPQNSHEHLPPLRVCFQDESK